MKKIEIYAIIIVVLFIAGAVVTVKIQEKRIAKLEAENLRLEFNQSQLLKDNKELSVLTLRKDEVIGKYKLQRDSLAEALEIRPKEVIQIKTEIITQHDTIYVDVPVYNVSKDFWKIEDTGKCFVWKADAFLTDDSLNVKRTDFLYHNRTTFVYYKERPHKFLWFHFGKWQYFTDVTPECGEATTKEINFIR